MIKKKLEQAYYNCGYYEKSLEWCERKIEIKLDKLRRKRKEEKWKWKVITNKGNSLKDLEGNLILNGKFRKRIL